MPYYMEKEGPGGAQRILGLLYDQEVKYPSITRAWMGTRECPAMFRMMQLPSDVKLCAGLSPVKDRIVQRLESRPSASRLSNP